MNIFQIQHKVALNEASIARFRIALFEAIIAMGFHEEYAERVASGTMIRNEGDQHSDSELCRIQSYYNEIDTLQKANYELTHGAKQTTR